LPDAQVLAVARGELDPLTASLQTETAEHVGDGPEAPGDGEPGAGVVDDVASGDETQDDETPAEATGDIASGSSTAAEPPGDADRAEG
jgi:hypothetical protein